MTNINKLLTVLAALSLAACLDNPEQSDVESNIDRVYEARAELVLPKDSATELADVRTDEHAAEAPSTCADVIETEGPCAFACDPEKVADFIVAGTCTTFVCHLANGDDWFTGGCNL